MMPDKAGHPHKANPMGVSEPTRTRPPRLRSVSPPAPVRPARLPLLSMDATACRTCHAGSVSTSAPAPTTSTSDLTPRRLYRILAVAETVTWTLLILGMIGKYILELG